MRKFRAWWIRPLVVGAVVVWQSSVVHASQCNQYFLGKNETEQTPVVHLWPESRPFFFLMASDLFPESFLEQIRAHGDEVVVKAKDKFRTNKDGTVQSFWIELSILTQNGHRIGQIFLARGGNTDSLELAGLSLTAPPYLQVAPSRHQGRTSKGLPAQVFLEVKSRLFRIIRQAGFRRIEIAGTQDFSVLMLYRRLVGAEPVTEIGRAIVDQLLEIFNYPGWTEFLGHPLTLDQFSAFLGRGDGRQKGLSEYELTKVDTIGNQYTYDVLDQKADKATESLVHPELGVIARKNGSEVFVYLPLLKPNNDSTKNKIVTWWQLHYERPEDMKLVVDLD